MYGTLDISVSGMIAQRTRQAVATANLANINVLEDAQGNYAPYLRRHAMFATGDPSASSPDARALGVHISAIDIDASALRSKYDPSSPHADEAGYVMVPDISPVIEQMNAMEAARAYEANLAAAEATKTMMAQALRLVA
jgi:flagellar basal-body rod protein FlgC